MEIRKLLTATTLVALSISTANAALVGRLAATEGGTDYQAYYDTEADLTWLADANAGAGSIFDDGYLINDGAMTWQAANDWAASITVAGVSNWRLANSDDCYGYDCTSDEMGSLYYNAMGNVAGSDLITGPFSNIQTNRYWSATEALPDTDDYAKYFGMNFGNKGYTLKFFEYHAWAVYTGDVSAVPVPAAVWLFGSGLIGLVGFARRNKVLNLN